MKTDIDTKESISKKIIRNTGYNMAGRFFSIAAALLLTPYIIRHIGVERFGIWAIVGVVTGYFGLLDLGIGTSFVKYISEYYTKKDYEKINHVINTGFFFYSVLAVIIIVLSLLFMRPILNLFNIPPSLFGETIFVLWISILIFAFSNSLGIFAAVQAGLQRMDISNILCVAVSVLNALGTVIFLKKGYGLRGLMINNAIIFLIAGLFNIIIAFKILPELKFRPLALNLTMFKNLFLFGYKLQVSRLANLISFQTDKLLITYFLGLGMVTFYQVGSSLLQQVRQVPLMLISVLVPAVSEIEAKGKKEYLKELYLIGSKYLILVSIPITFFIFVNAHLIMLAWMGKGYQMTVTVIRILAVGYLAATVSGMASSIAAGVARTEFDMKFGLFMAVLNLSLSIFLIIKIGFIGVVIGTTTALTLATIYYLNMFHRYLGCRFINFAQLFYKPVIACLAPSIAIFLLDRFVLPVSFFRERIFNITVLALYSGIFCLGYFIFILASDYLSEYDKDLIRTRMPLSKYLLGGQSEN